MSAVVPNALPSRWAAATIGELLDTPVEQIGPPSHHETFVYVDIGSVDNTTKRIVERQEMLVTAAPSRARQVLRQGDVLVSMTRPNLNAVALVTKEFAGAIGSTGFFVLRSQTVEPRWIFYAVQTQGFVSAMCDVVQGALYPAVRPKDIARWVCLIPPRTEQQRIVDTLDELLSDLDAGVAALERVRARLKHYRAAVLKAAVEGALTAQWRREHPATETADALLTRILIERRRRWEEAQLKKFEAAGKAPPKNWKEKYVEPVATDSGSLPATPEGWCWASIDQLSLEVRNGYSAKPDATTGVPILRISAVRPYSIDLHDRRYLSGRELDYASDQIAEGDLLFTRYNGSRNLVGVCAVVPKLDEPIVHPDKLIRARLVESESASAFTGLAANVGASRKYIEQRIRTTAGQTGVSGSDVKALPVPLPPIAEQAAIVEAVEDQLSVIDHLERDLDARLQSAQSLRQSILRHAFTGQLVPQDPNDEPASELLKRIAAEREARAQLAAVAKRKAKPAKAGRARDSRRARTDARE